MNERQAEKEGLRFEGSSARPWDEKQVEQLKKEASEIRKQGFRAVVVESGIHEWGGGSRLLYTDPDYQLSKWLERNASLSIEKYYIREAEKECIRIMEEAHLKQAKIDQVVADARERLAARKST